MAKYRKLPVIIEAEVYRNGLEDGFIYEIKNEFGESRIFPNAHDGLKTYLTWFGMFDDVKERVIPYVDTLKGKRCINEGDYIITEINGEKYPCKPDIFEAKYELISE
jgi:hypothetical protein